MIVAPKSYSVWYLTVVSGPAGNGLASDLYTSPSAFVAMTCYHFNERPLIILISLVFTRLDGRLLHMEGLERSGGLDAGRMAIYL